MVLWGYCSRTGINHVSKDSRARRRIFWHIWLQVFLMWRVTNVNLRTRARKCRSNFLVFCHNFCLKRNSVSVYVVLCGDQSQSDVGWLLPGIPTTYRYTFATLLYRSQYRVVVRQYQVAQPNYQQDEDTPAGSGSDTTNSCKSEWNTSLHASTAKDEAQWSVRLTTFHKKTSQKQSFHDCEDRKTLIF